MKKFIPYLLFSATSFHAIIGISPATAMGCSSQSDKAEAVCEAGKVKCNEKTSSKAVN